MKIPTSPQGYALPSFRSLVFSSKFILFLIGAGLIFVATFVTQSMNQETQEATNQDPVIVRLEEAKGNMDAKLAEINEERGRFDTDPRGPTRPGTSQRLIASLAVEIRTRVIRMAGDPKGRWYNYPLFKIYDSLRADNMDRAVSAETSQKATYTYYSHRLEKEVTVAVDPELQMSIALTYLTAIDLAEYGTTLEKASLQDSRIDIAKQESEKRIAGAGLLEAKGQIELAAEKLETDPYGLKIRSDQAVYQNRASEKLEKLKKYHDDSHHNVVTGSPN